VAAWVGHIYALALGLDACRRLDIDAPLAEAQTSASSDVKDILDRAELRIEMALAALGAIYSRLLLLNAGDMETAKIQRLHDNVASQVAALREIQSSLDEVYQVDSKELSAAKH
jgi:hypothetical protein